MLCRPSGSRTLRTTGGRTQMISNGKPDIDVGIIGGGPAGSKHGRLFWARPASNVRSSNASCSRASMSANRWSRRRRACSATSISCPVMESPGFRYKYGAAWTSTNDKVRTGTTSGPGNRLRTALRGAGAARRGPAVHVSRRSRQVRPGPAPARAQAGCGRARGRTGQRRRLRVGPYPTHQVFGRGARKPRRPPHAWSTPAAGGRCSATSSSCRVRTRSSTSTRCTPGSATTTATRCGQGRTDEELHLHPLPADLQHLGVADSDHRVDHQHRRGHAEEELRQVARTRARSSSGSASRPGPSCWRPAQRPSSSDRSRTRATTATR